jgi:hypothetical protein
MHANIWWKVDSSASVLVIQHSFLKEAPKHVYEWHIQKHKKGHSYHENMNVSKLNAMYYVVKHKHSGYYVLRWLFITSV